MDRSLHNREARLGLLYGLGSYLWWGGVPIYFHLVSHVQPLAVLAHRIVWSVVFLLLIVAAQHRWAETARVVRNRRMMLMLTLGSVLVAVNWFVFIYAVTIGHVLQASLGYYICPMVNVLLGMLFLGERLRTWQWVAVGLATTGVVYLTLQGATFPWISLMLASSFGLYALVRKKIIVGPVVGLLVETAILLPAAVIIFRMPLAGWAEMTLGTFGLLSLAGVVTAVPLLWFVSAVRRLRLATMGFLQYAGPTVQFLVAVLFLGEHLRSEQLVTFAFIWTALIVYTVDSIRDHRPPQPAALSVE